MISSKLALMMIPFALQPIVNVYTTQAGSTYPYGGGPTRITVPSGYNFIRVSFIAGGGGAGSYNTGIISGPGGGAYGKFPVTAGQQFDLWVGQGGQGASGASTGLPSGGLGGWPNGGFGTYGDTAGGGGGGRTEIRRVSDNTSMVIAGGGGGTSGYVYHGGSGGGTSGLNGTSGTTSGGSQVSAGPNAAQYQGGQFGSPTTSTSDDHGGGGDGWYGGGASSGDGPSGGGGSGYLHASVTEGGFWVGSNGVQVNGNIPTTILGNSTSGYGDGKNSVAASSSGSNGGHGFAVVEILP